MSEKTCAGCGAVHGQLGAKDRNGEWHEDHDIHCMNSDIGHHLFRGEFPDTKVAAVCTTKDGTLMCRSCLMERVRPTMPKPARPVRLNPQIVAGQMELIA